MWSSRAAKAGFRATAAALVLAAPLALAGCSGFSPVYGTPSLSAKRIELAYAAPSNRIEQLIYQDLRLRIPRAGGPAPALHIDTTTTSTGLTNNVVTTAQGPQSVTVSADIVLTDADGKVLFTGTRSQSADYNSSPQVLAGSQAANDAAQRAAHLLADTIRLTVLGALAK